jgi:hypothetical protein
MSARPVSTVLCHRVRSSNMNLHRFSLAEWHLAGMRKLCRPHGRGDHRATLGPWDFETLGPWDFETLGPWDFETLRPWDLETLRL